MDLVQKQTFRYFWDFAHPVSGLARERSNHSTQLWTGNYYIRRYWLWNYGDYCGCRKKMDFKRYRSWAFIEDGEFLRKADKYHGVFPHWLNGETGRTIPFSPKDDGGDLVETAYLFQGLLCARQYFNQNIPKENQLRNRITGCGMILNGIGLPGEASVFCIGIGVPIMAGV